MKKLLISIGSILIITSLVVLFINATESKKDTTKANTEVTKSEAAVPCPAACNLSTGVKTATCNPEKCKEVNCYNDGTCDPATCSMQEEGKPEEGQICGSSTTCKGTCHTVTAESK